MEFLFLLILPSSANIVCIRVHKSLGIEMVPVAYILLIDALSN